MSGSGSSQFRKFQVRPKDLSGLPVADWRHCTFGVRLQGIATACLGRAIGLQIQVLNASTTREIEEVFETLARERPDALFVGPDAFFTERRVQLVNLSSRHAIPTAYGARDFGEAGGLMSYGTSLLF